MISWLVHRRIRAAERRYGGSLEYLRHMYSSAPQAFFKLMKLAPAARHRKVIPVAALHAARLAAARLYGCSGCVKIAGRLALLEGLPASLVQSLVDGRRDRLDDELYDVYVFAEATTAGSDDVEAARNRVRRRFGEEGVIELSLAVAFAGVLPTLRRGLGFAEPCERRAEEPATNATPAEAT